MLLKDKKIALGVTGSIAIYKSCDLVSKLTQAEADVHVVMTDNATKFVSPMVFEVLSGSPVLSGVFQPPTTMGISHIDISIWADIFVIAPVTANVIGKLANGIADDLLTTTLLAVTCPILIAPAMNTRMYNNPILQENLQRLLDRGYTMVPAEEGYLAEREYGVGRMAAVEDLIEEITLVVNSSDRLAGKRVIVTAGRTEEPLDPVRHLTNRSSGKMGYALARGAIRRGAEVILITGPSVERVPRHANVIRVRTAEEMLRAVESNIDDADLILMAAAVGDFAPAKYSDTKIKRNGRGLELMLESTEDILKAISVRKDDKTLTVGFALETDNMFPSGKKKLAAKELDLIVLNNPLEKEAGFEVDTNKVTLLYKSGEVVELPLMSKDDVAENVLEAANSIQKVKEVEG